MLCLYLSLPNQGPTTWSTKVLVSHGLELSQGSIGSICQAVGQRKNAGGYGCKKMWKHFPQLFSPKDPKVLLTYHVVPQYHTVFLLDPTFLGPSHQSEALWMHREHTVSTLWHFWNWFTTGASCPFHAHFNANLEDYRPQGLKGLVAAAAWARSHCQAQICFMRLLRFFWQCIWFTLLKK